MRFEILHRSAPGPARTGRIATSRGEIPTPAFMPVGTRASVKAILPPQLREAGASILLANTFHLALRPGSPIIREMGGIQRFMGWDGPVLTDSGGFQVFSLEGLRKVTEEGVVFRSPVDGNQLFLSPEKAIEIQEDLGVEIAMALDQLVGAQAPRGEVEAALERTHRWALRCREAQKAEGTALFGIVQGGMFADLRAQSARALAALDLPGYAAGGFSVGEAKTVFREMAALTARAMPEEKPRYLMGVGTPLDLVEAVGWGYDLFDCVLPTRNARNGMLFTSQGGVSIKNAEFIRDPAPLDPACPCWGCRSVSRAYLNHLFRANDPTGMVLNTLHNLTFYLGLMGRIRDAIEGGTLPTLRDEVAAAYGEDDPAE